MISSHGHDQCQLQHSISYPSLLSFSNSADGCAQLGAKKLATPARPIWRFCSTNRQNQAVFHRELSFSPKGEAQEKGPNRCDSAQRAVQVWSDHPRKAVRSPAAVATNHDKLSVD